eukprot:scaffold22443_cov62-Phaeocystis_antarctica.AAC.11
MVYSDTVNHRASKDSSAASRSVLAFALPRKMATDSTPGPPEADWPRPAEAWGSLRRDLALQAVKPAGRRLSQPVLRHSGAPLRTPPRSPACRAMERLTAAPWYNVSATVAIEVCVAAGSGMSSAGKAPRLSASVCAEALRRRASSASSPRKSATIRRGHIESKRSSATDIFLPASGPRASAAEWRAGARRIASFAKAARLRDVWFCRSTRE